MLLQEAEALLAAVRKIGEWARGEHLENLVQQRLIGGDIAQGAPDHDLEVGSHLVHQADRQCRLANAAQAEHADHSRVLLDYPPGEGGQFPLPPVESRNRKRIIPIHPWSLSVFDYGLLIC